MCLHWRWSPAGHPGVFRPRAAESQEAPEGLWAPEESQGAVCKTYLLLLPPSCNTKAQLARILCPWRAVPSMCLRQGAVQVQLPTLVWSLGCSWMFTSLVIKAFPISVYFLSIVSMSGKSCCGRAWSTSKMPRERTGALQGPCICQARREISRVLASTNQLLELGRNSKSPLSFLFPISSTPEHHLVPWGLLCWEHRRPVQPQQLHSLLPHSIFIIFFCFHCKNV